MSKRRDYSALFHSKTALFLIIGIGIFILMFSYIHLRKELKGEENYQPTKINKLRVHPLQADTLIMLVKNGDLIFRKGISMVSRLVTTSDKNGIYSHIGLITIDDSGPMVIHAVPDEPIKKGDLDRVKIEPLTHFLSEIRASKALLMRTDIGCDTLRKVIKEAKRYVNQHTLFDHEFDLDTDDKVYCTEFIYKIFLFKGLDLTEERRSIYTIPVLGGTYIFPSDIQRNKRLTCIYSY